MIDVALNVDYPFINPVVEYVRRNGFIVVSIERYFNELFNPLGPGIGANQFLFYEFLTAYSTSNILQMSADLVDILGNTYTYRANATSEFAAVINYENAVTLRNLLIKEINNVTNVGFASAVGWTITYK